MTDTSAEAVERLAKLYSDKFGFPPDEGTPLQQHTAATLRALVAERDAAQRRLAAVFRAWAILHNTLNCIIHEEDNDPPDVANAIRIARNGLDEAGREMDAADMLPGDAALARDFAAWTEGESDG